jgi:Cu2+-exporting ATPase
MSEAQPTCFHCGLPVPPGSRYPVEIDGVTRNMCCPGCQAVAQAIVDGGLIDFYRHRTGTSATARNLIPDELEALSIYDQPEVQRSFVRDESDDSTHIKQAALILEGIVCAACIWLNERHVNALPGVIEFRVNYSTHRASVKWDDAMIHLSDILRAIAAIGYIAHPFDPGRQEQLYKKERHQALKRLAVAGLGAMQVMMLAVAMYAGDYYGMESHMQIFFRWVSLVIATPVVFYSARPFFQGAWRDIRRRQLGMDVPVALAVGGAYLASCWATISHSGEVYFDSVTMFTFFLLAGRYLEMAARHRAGQATEELVKMLPAMATRLTPQGGEVVAVAELRPGDRVRIKPGDSIPADGRVVEGRSSVDESLLTGESLPLTRGVGERLVGGSVNVESPLVMAVEKVGEDTVLAAIQRLLNRAQSEKPRLASMADRVAGWFVGVILLLAALTGWWWQQHDPAQAGWIVLSMLVVTCPCALSLATPAALTAATGSLTRMGVLTTRGHALETLARATHIVLDKTGTLTVGRLVLEKVNVLGVRDEASCLQIAAALEQVSEHPVGRALAKQDCGGLQVEDANAVPGLGVEGLVDGIRFRIGRPDYVAALSGTLVEPGDEATQTEVVLGDERGLLARFALGDALRPGAEAAIAELRQLGLSPMLYSGDSLEVVARVANQLGIADFSARMRPDDKLQSLKTLQARGAVVAMVGDGVNDAPVLAGAQISLAMGSGTQLAQATADMVLLSEDLRHIPEAVRMARATLRVIRQNLGWAVIYNMVALPLAAAGFVAPWLAAIGMSASSLLVVLNALRLNKPYTATQARPARLSSASPVAMS